jgi:hypothetical protein
VTIEDPVRTKYAEFSKGFFASVEADNLKMGRFAQRVRNIACTLPCGLNHQEAAMDDKLTVATAFGLQPRVTVVTLMPEIVNGFHRIACIGALSGEDFGVVLVSESTTFQRIWIQLAKTCGLPASAVIFVTCDGVQLDADRNNDNVISFFESQPVSWQCKEETEARSKDSVGECAMCSGTGDYGFSRCTWCRGSGKTIF